MFGKRYKLKRATSWFTMGSATAVRRNREREAVGKDALVLQAMGTANANLEWLAKHYEEVRHKAAGRFIVVYSNRLVGMGPDADSAIRASGLRTEQLPNALIDYVPADGESWIL